MCLEIKPELTKARKFQLNTAYKWWLEIKIVEPTIRATAQFTLNHAFIFILQGSALYKECESNQCSLTQAEVDSNVRGGIRV